MIDFIERVGPWLGFVSLAVLVVLALLYFQQARQIRRLREWAGRAPERAAEVARELAEQGVAPDPAVVHATRTSRFFGAIGDFFGRVGDRITDAYYAIDRRSPIDFRAVLGLLAVVAVAAVVVLVKPFGLLEDDVPATDQSSAEDDRANRGNGNGEGRNQNAGRDDQGAEESAGVDPADVQVAVLNATETGVPGLAGELAEVVGGAGYEVGAVTNAATPYANSLVMFAGDSRDAALRVADDLQGELGELEVLEISQDIADLAGNADVVLVIGQDDSEF